MLTDPTIADGDRIINGLCNINATSSAKIGEMTQPTNGKIKLRIKNGKCAGTGDSGDTQLSSGTIRSSKGEEASHFYGNVEELQDAIAELLEHHFNVAPLMQEDVVEALEWLHEASFSLNGFCFSSMEGVVSSKHAFPEELHNYVIEQTEIWQQRYASSPDFQYYVHKNLILLSRVRIKIRAVERWFCAWMKSDQMKLIMMNNQPLADLIKRQEQTLNRFSTFMWCATNREAERLGCPKKFWRGSMPPFNLSARMD